MKALVTGGVGFAGAHLVRALLARGHRVSSLDVVEGDPEVAAEFREHGVNAVIGSVDDPAVMERLVPGHDVVFNLASAFRDIRGGAPVFQRTDVGGTEVLLDVARRAGVARVVHCSTQGVHGSLPPSAVPGNEDSPIAPIDTYCEAKADAERVCRRFIDAGSDIVILRPASIYGPGDTYGWLKLFRACRRGRFPMLGSGRTLNHPVYVENLAKAFIAAAEIPEARGRTYLIADDECISLNDLVRLVAEVQGRTVRMLRFPWLWPVQATAAVMEAAFAPFGVDPPLFRRRLTWYTTNRCWDLSRARRDLGYRPAIDLREGLRRTMVWYESRGLL